MVIENNNELLREQLGKGVEEVFTTVAQTGKDWYAVQFVLESVVSAITVADCTGEASLVTTIPAGTTLFMNIQSITLTSGLAIGYVE